MPGAAVEFLRVGAPFVVGLGLALSWLAARLAARRLALTRNSRRGLYLGVGAVNGLALVALVALAVAR